MDKQTLQDLCPQSQQIPLLIFAWILLGAAILITTLRLYSKSRNISGITIDDYLALASTILAAGAVSFLTIWIHTGLGRHAPCQSDPRSTLFWSLLAQVFTIIGICLLKASVCICVLNVLEHSLRLLRFSIWALIIFLTASHIAHVVFLFLQCQPLDALWDASVQGAKCFDNQQLALIYYIGYGAGALTDFVCASIPLAVIIRPRLSDRSRIGLCVLVGFGTLIAGCAVAKTITSSNAWSADFTWNSVVPTWFTIAEYYGGIVLASIPSLAAFFSPNARSSPNPYAVDRNGSLDSMPRKGSAWTLAAPRFPRPTVSKKHLSISTFGLSEGEEGSRLTLVENRFTMLGEDDERLTCVDEEGVDDPERASLDGRSVRTATLKGAQGGWNQEAVIELNMLGKGDRFGKESRAKQQPESRGHSIYSIGRSTRPGTPRVNTPKRLSISTRPTTPRSITRPSSKPGTPKSPGFPRMPRSLRMPGTSKRSVRTSVASSNYSDPPVSAGLATIPSPPASFVTLPTTLHTSSRPTTPKTPGWTTSPSGFTVPRRSRTPTTPGLKTSAGSGSRTPNGTGTPRGSRPGTPSRSISVVVPVSKFRAEISEEAAVEARKVGKFSDLRKEMEKALPRAPLEVRVVDIPAVKTFDPHDTTY